MVTPTATYLSILERSETLDAVGEVGKIKGGWAIKTTPIMHKKDPNMSILCHFSPKIIAA